MSAIINALFGTYPDADQQNNAGNQITVAGSNAITTERLHTSATSEDVQVNSVISTETQANATINTKLNIDNLLSQLNTTHSQVDHYSRARTAEINELVQRQIADVLANTHRLQEELITDANCRHLSIDNVHKVELQKAVEALDGVKAKALSELERDLHAKQQVILADAKRQIDVLNDQANAAKLHALVEAQEQAKHNISNLADQVAILGHNETQHLLESKTTTIITSSAQATGQPEPVVIVPVTETNITTIVDSKTTDIAVKGQTAIATLGTSEHTTAFGTATGASNLTKTPAAVESSTTTHTQTQVKSSHDNTNF